MLARFTHRQQRVGEFAELERAVQRISRAEIPDAAARSALAAAVRAGAVIGVYVPAGYQDRHTIELGHLPPDIDPRTTCAQWVAWWRAGKNPMAEHLAAQRIEQLQARLEAMPGPVKSFDVRCREQLDELERTGELTPRAVAHLRAEMARTAPDVTAYAYHLAGVGACVWDDALARHSTAAEYDSYLEALAEIRSEADCLGGQSDQEGQG
jgi:hypothetical protein